jgi:hypothetical protein
MRVRLAELACLLLCCLSQDGLGRSRRAGEWRSWWLLHGSARGRWVGGVAASGVAGFVAPGGARGAAGSSALPSAARRAPVAAVPTLLRLLLHGGGGGIGRRHVCVRLRLVRQGRAVATPHAGSAAAGRAAPSCSFR